MSLGVVATFKPFCFEPSGGQQYTAAFSWSLNDPTAVVVIGDDLGSKEQAEQYDWKFVPYVVRGTNVGQSVRAPVVPSVVDVALRHLKCEFLCLMNSDLIVSPSFFTRVLSVAEEYGEGFFGTGNRIDYKWSTPITTRAEYVKLWKTQRKKGRYHKGGGTDFFVAHRSFWQRVAKVMPRFLMGCLAWDNWLQWAGATYVPHSVNLTRYVDTLHPLHHYESLMSDLGQSKKSRLRGNSAVAYNRSLYNGQKAKFSSPSWIQLASLRGVW